MNVIYTELQHEQLNEFKIHSYILADVALHLFISLQYDNYVAKRTHAQLKYNTIQIASSLDNGRAGTK